MTSAACWRVASGGNWVIKSTGFMSAGGEIHRKYSICTPGASLVTGHDRREFHKYSNGLMCHFDIHVVNVLCLVLICNSNKQ